MQATTNPNRHVAMCACGQYRDKRYSHDCTATDTEKRLHALASYIGPSARTMKP